MFWGLVIETGKRYAQIVDKSFHLSMACLEPNSSENEFVPVMLDIDNQEYVLCNLHRHKTIQCQLDLNFNTGSKIAFYTPGKGRIHLTGYAIEDDDNLDLTGDMSDLEDEEEEETSPVKQVKVSNALQNKRKSNDQVPKPETKKAKLNQIEPEDSDEEDDEEDDEEEEGDGMFADSGSEELSGDDSDEEDDDDSDDMAATQVQKTPELKKDKLKKISMDKINKTPVDKYIQLNKAKTPVESQEKKKKKKSLNQSAIGSETPKTPATVEANGSHPTPHPSKKKNKKASESPAAETPKAGSQTPGTPGGGLMKKTLQGGVHVQDLKLGDGQVAKAGRKVSVYYVGRLKQNNKEFDAANSGSGFKFELGRGEVIKGWDIGVTGMRVGGKRRITCPPHMAYGNKGVPPTIPPNSSLVFEVELRSVN